MAKNNPLIPSPLSKVHLKDDDPGHTGKYKEGEDVKIRLEKDLKHLQIL